MTAETAKLIFQAAQDLGLNVDHLAHYSGRGMFGKTTDALAFENAAELAAAAYEAGCRLDHDDPRPEVIGPELARCRIDAFGHGLVIY